MLTLPWLWIIKILKGYEHAQHNLCNFLKFSWVLNVIPMQLVFANYCFPSKL